MYIVREIFHLQFGRYRDAKKLLDQAIEKKLMTLPEGSRVVTDFTGAGYRLILELPFASLAEYESSLQAEMSADDWRKWYDKFILLVRHSEREILKQVM